MNDRYPALRFVATVLKVMGALVVLAGILLLLFMLAHLGEKSEGWFQGILMVVGLIGGGVSIFAFGNLIDLLMDIEQNTRESAWFARQAHGEAPEMIP